MRSGENYRGEESGRAPDRDVSFGSLRETHPLVLGKTRAPGATKVQSEVGRRGPSTPPGPDPSSEPSRDGISWGELPDLVIKR